MKISIQLMLFREIDLRGTNLDIITADPNHPFRRHAASGVYETKGSPTYGYYQCDITVHATVLD
jgi:hypothetical protein